MDRIKGEPKKNTQNKNGISERGTPAEQIGGGYSTHNPREEEERRGEVTLLLINSGGSIAAAIPRQKMRNNTKQGNTLVCHK